MTTPEIIAALGALLIAVVAICVYLLKGWLGRHEEHLIRGHRHSEILTKHETLIVELAKDFDRLESEVAKLKQIVNGVRFRQDT